MQESAKAALSYVHSRAKDLGIDDSVFAKSDMHIHVPSGAIPKDGPSAGVSITTSVVSALTGIPVLRDVGMTGEITLRGRILPIGGLKEKLLAAKRAGLRKVVLPSKNKKDVGEVPESITKGLELVFVDNIAELLPHTLERSPFEKNNVAGNKVLAENKTSVFTTA
jgi:ATP-dependent Lon protease